MKTPFRLASYVVGRERQSGTRVLFDHMFTYFR
jgi:molybdate-binding protein